MTTYGHKSAWFNKNTSAIVNVKNQNIKWREYFELAYKKNVPIVQFVGVESRVAAPRNAVIRMRNAAELIKVDIYNDWKVVSIDKIMYLLRAIGNPLSHSIDNSDFYHRFYAQFECKYMDPEKYFTEYMNKIASLVAHSNRYDVYILSDAQRYDNNPNLLKLSIRNMLEARNVNAYVTHLPYKDRGYALYVCVY